MTVPAGGPLLGALAALALLAGAPAALRGATALEANSCYACHHELEGDLQKPTAGIVEDIHYRRGLICNDCHGGDPTLGFDGDYEASMDPRKGFVGAPAREEIPAFCGRCHSNAEYMKKFNPNISVDQVAEYWTSTHGRRLREGDRKVATCISCHGVHGILPVAFSGSPVYPTNVPETCGHCHANGAYMAEYPIPTDQLERYRPSVHGVALLDRQDTAAPACNDCHGNHGAVPPGVSSVDNVCGLCHPTNNDLYIASPHKPAFDRLDLPGCVACHGNHDIHPPSDDLLGTGERALCAACHASETSGFRVAQQMRAALDSLEGSMGEARALVDRASHAGLIMDDASYELTEAQAALTLARVKVHAFALGPVQEAVFPGLQRAALARQAGLAAQRELRSRRLGLALSSALLLLIVLGLYNKIREIERR